MSVVPENYMNALWVGALIKAGKSHALLQGDPSKSEYIIEMPTYFGTLNTYLEGKEYSKRTFVNFLMIKFIAVSSFAPIHGLN